MNACTVFDERGTHVMLQRQSCMAGLWSNACCLIGLRLVEDIMGSMDEAEDILQCTMH